jgi:hypothetical protein
MKWRSHAGRGFNLSTVCLLLHLRFDSIGRLCADFRSLVAVLEQATGRKFEILQVKEKFGGLRIHLNHANDAIRQRLEAAREESLHTSRFAVSRANGGKAIGSRLCAMNTRAHREQENMAERSDEQLWQISRQKSSDLQTKKAAFAAFSGKKLTVLCCYEFGNGNLVEGRVDNVKGVNLRRSFDKSCQRL